MAMNSLKDVYIDMLQDLWSACTQSNDVTTSLQKAATDPELKDALEASIKGTREGIDMVVKLSEKHGFDPEGEHCKGMEGLVAEARAHALEEEFGDDAARDAMIIAQYQRMAHYAIAGWGTLKAYAERLGLEEDAKMLDEALGNTYDGDERFTSIATGKGGVNADAAA